jgi:glycosyltransferase involved in cell wall biosynthesis
MTDFESKVVNVKPYSPPISVILPVYNGRKTIREAVSSILGQTFRDFEFIIINDGSTDETAEILASFTDPRIRVLNQENRGFAASMNRGIMESRGRYIARMDADDVALPERFAKQLDFLEINPTVGVLGAANQVVYSDGTKAVRCWPLNTARIKKNIVRISPVPHSVAMIRREVFDRVGLYACVNDDANCLVFKDYDLWVRVLAAGYDMANLPEVLMINYREANSIMRSKSLKNLLRQRIIGRMDIIKRLNLSCAEYLNIIPVIILTLLNYYNIIKLDKLFSYLSNGKSQDSSLSHKALINNNCMK